MSAEAEAGTRRRRSPLLITVLILGVLALLVVLAAHLYTNYLWFRSVSATTVFTTQLAARVGLFLGFGLLLGGGFFGSLILAYRLRPPVRRTNLDSELLLQLRDNLDRRSRTLILLPAVVLGLIGGGVAASQVQTFLAWTRATDFGKGDAVFGIDASFYVFQLPWWRFVLAYLNFMVVACLVGSLLVHFLTGSMNAAAFRKTGNLPSAGKAAQRQVSVLLGLGLLLYGVSSFLDRYGYLTSQNSLFTGVDYTDATSRIPASLIVAAIAGICALLCFYNAWRVKWSVPGIALGLLVVSAMILTAVYPWGIRYFVVKPNEPDLERPWIANNIEATRGAFGIDSLQISDYEAVDSVSAGQLRADAAALPAIRLMDPSVIGPTFEQLQQVRGYYRFPSTLDVDRYSLEGRETDAVVAARELDLNAVEAGNTWNNMHTVYTHGYGLVAAYGNRRESNGEPNYFSGGIPTEGLIQQEQPRIYFGEESKHWGIAGAPEGAEPVELDTPGGGQEHTETKYTYQGSGGVPIGDFLNKTAFAVRFGDINLLLSERVNSNSRLLFNRVPADRVKEVAPFLTVDSDSYPTVVNGRIVWVIDAYTTTAEYPNSTRADWPQATKDTRTTSERATAGDLVNYVRNSVKATVDAYDGTVTLYGWDESDPILQTWSKVYPGLITPKSEISPELMSHLRYPQDLFKVQRQMLGLYHTTNPYTFFQQSDIWEVPSDPVNGGESGTKEPPYFLTIKWPGEEQAHYSNTTVFVPRGRENLSVYMAVNADATSPNYGQLRALKLSDAKQIPGPGQTFNAISTNEAVAERLLPYNRQGNAKAIYGNLLTLPVGGGLMYVQPIYSATSGGYPALRFVVVRFGEHVGIGDTLKAALDQVFKGDAGAETGEKPVEQNPEGQQKPPASEGDAKEQAKALLKESMDLFAAADEALKSGDLATYQQRVNEAKAKAEQALALFDQ
ncbi:MAG: UPF0182 family protein [Propionibacterium sp.]|nr:UPF0182 family protein [Propionibacterium sp.]